MPLSSRAVLLVRVLHCDSASAKVLAVHGLYRHVRRLEAVIIDEGKALGRARVRVSHALGRVADDDSKRGKGVVQQLLVHVWVQIAQEEVGTHLGYANLAARLLVQTQRLSVKLDHLHDLDRVVRVFLGLELHEAESLVRVGHLVLGDVHVCNGPRLQEQLPQQLLRARLCDVADIDCGILIALGHVLRRRVHRPARAPSNPLTCPPSCPPGHVRWAAGLSGPASSARSRSCHEVLQDQVLCPSDRPHPRTRLVGQ